MKHFTIPCDTRNHGGRRAGRIEYIVVHFTAGDGDTAIDNGLYFSRNRVGASAHYFVDETSVVSSVPVNRVAWHCGGDFYRHPDCRNYNSVGVELVSRKDADGQYYFADETVWNAVKFIRELMKRYNIEPACVVRHYDVTGKVCPAPFVGAGENDWWRFVSMIAEKRYNTIDDCPDWSKATVQKLMDKDILQGDSKGELNLSMDMIRIFVINDRAGIYDRR